VPETLAEAQMRLAETEPNPITALPDGYAYVEVPSNYAGIAQREEKSLQRRVEKETRAAQKAWRKLSMQTFNCPEDALSASQDLEKRWKYHQAQAETSPLTRYPNRGRPAEGASPDVVGYQLQGQVVISEHALEEARRKLGRFILATNETDPDLLSAQAMLSQYKAQAISVERGFRFLKDPLFFAESLFLKNPGRIMALIMIMVLALLVYSLAERKLRLQLAESGQSALNQVGKETQTPTMRWVFQVFEGIDLLIIRQNDQIVHRQVLNLQQKHLTVLRLLGPPVENCYNL
jgi:transposase